MILKKPPSLASTTWPTEFLTGSRVQDPVNLLQQHAASQYTAQLTLPQHDIVRLDPAPAPPATAPFQRPDISVPGVINRQVVFRAIANQIPVMARRAGFTAKPDADPWKGTHKCPRLLPGRAENSIGVTAQQITDNIMQWESLGEPPESQMRIPAGLLDRGTKTWAGRKEQLQKTYGVIFPIHCFNVYNDIRSKLVVIRQYLRTADVTHGGKRTQEALNTLAAEARPYFDMLNDFFAKYILIWTNYRYYGDLACNRPSVFHIGIVEEMCRALDAKHKRLVAIRKEFLPGGKVDRVLNAARSTVEQLVELEFQANVEAAATQRHIAAEESEKASEAQARQYAAEAAAQAALDALKALQAEGRGMNVTPWLIGAATLAAGGFFLLG